MGMLIFGDSYVAAADRGRPGYARLVPPLLGQRGTHMGSGGTGFVKSNGERGPYASRLPALLARDADTVIIQATGNDALCAPTAVESQARDFLTVTARKFPRVVVVGPMWAKDGAENLPELCDRVRAACDAVGVEFIDARSWLRPNLIGKDGAHPTHLGHLIIAVRLAAAVRRSPTRKRR